MAAAEQSVQMERYDPLVAPDAQEWLALDEQDRVHLAQDYHERAGIIVPNAKLHAVAHVIVENQVALADALPVERTLRRLMAEGLNRHEACMQSARRSRISFADVNAWNQSFRN